MPKIVVDGAQLKCSEGLQPGSLTITPDKQTTGDDKPIATVMDFVPMKNIGAFGMCKAMANPQVASATSAAQGVLTPQPCVPNTTAPWSPGSKIAKLNELAILTEDSKCNCMWTGSIEIVSAGGAVETD